MSLFDLSSGCFFAGTVPRGTPPGAGVEPNGLPRGDEVINTYLSLGAQTAATLALAITPPYRDQIDWRRPLLQCALEHFAQQITVGNQAFFGFTVSASSSAGSSDAVGITWESTGRVGVAMRVVGRLYQDVRLDEAADFYLSEIRRAFTIPMSTGPGLVASMLQEGEAWLPREPCLRTPFRCIPERVELAATVWALFADWNLNPLSPSMAH